MKRMGLVLAAIICLGCSSLCEIVAHNRSDKPIRLHVTDAEHADWSGTIEPGKSAKVWRGYEGPKGLKFVVDGRLYLYDRNSLPSDLANARSAGVEADWVWDGAKGTILTGEDTIQGQLTKKAAQIFLAALLVALGAVLWIGYRQAKKTEAARRGGNEESN